MHSTQDILFQKKCLTRRSKLLNTDKMETYTLITKLLEQLSYDEAVAAQPANEKYIKAIHDATNVLIELKKFY